MVKSFFMGTTPQNNWLIYILECETVASIVASQIT